MHTPKQPKAIPPPAPPPAPPTVDEARLRVQEDQRMRLRRGRAATVLAPTDAGKPQTLGSAANLLGQ